MKRSIVAVAAALALILAACGDDRESSTTAGPDVAYNPDDSTVTPDSMPPMTETMPAPDTSMATGLEGVLNVPEDYDTIQGAVDAAVPGDLILISPGTYQEAVNVETDDLTIRGLDRNEVVLDGNFELENGIRILGASGVAVENMTAMNYTRNGFFWTGTDGFRGSYLTAYRTGDYGVYAFDSMNGQLEFIYAAGSPDAGVYIGECFPCNTVLTNTVSEHNGLGYSGTNAGGNLFIINSVFRNNRAGIVPNSGSYELCYPQRETTIIGNLVYSNNQADTPAIDVALLAMGNGILSAGGVRNDIERNLVWDHDKSGIGLVPFLEDNPNDEIPTKDEWELTCEESQAMELTDPGGPLLWDSYETRVIGNVLEDNREGDIIVASAGTDVSTLGHCFLGNTLTFTQPNNLETLAPCDAAAGSGDWKDGEYNVAAWLGETRPPSIDWKTATLPELTAQENMPDAADAPAKPATDVPYEVDLDAITVPSKPT